MYSDWSSDWEGESDESQSKNSHDSESEWELVTSQVGNETETLIQVFEGCNPEVVNNVSKSQSDKDGKGSADRQSEKSQTETVIMASRAYQLEMLEESMKQNVIVAVG